MIGGFSLVFDKAIRVGDFLKVGETTGTVEFVGLRSTRIRTLDRRHFATYRIRLGHGRFAFQIIR